MARSLSSSSSSSLTPQETNTLAVTSLPKSFFNPLVLSMLRDHFGSFGDINQWVPLQGFGRIIVVYEFPYQAELAKQGSDPILVNDDQGKPIILRVYRGDSNPLIPPGEQKASRIPLTSYLQPPAIEKNFLISPPGSPPIGWEPIQEDPPNRTPLAEDLMTALKRLKVHEDTFGKPSFEQLLDPLDGPGVGVYVENCDADLDFDEFGLEVVEEQDWIYGTTAPAREKWSGLRTAMPPVTSSSA